jgi:hypothetical protein
MYKFRMNKTFWYSGVAALAALVSAAQVASAQPWIPNKLPDPATPPPTAPPTATTPTAPSPPQPTTTPADPAGTTVQPTAPTDEPARVIEDQESKPFPADDAYRFKPKPIIKPLHVDLPEVLTTPTGFLLPAGILYSKSALDTGGGASSDLRLGLGDVAEFGIATTDQIRGRADATALPRRIQPYVTASFRLGISEDRLFRHQPGLTLGFRKSFERKYDDHTSKMAELTLVASKHLGPRATIHAGAAFWDAQVTSTNDATDTYVLHDQGLRKQLRAFGGIGVRATDVADVLIDVGWTPEFCYTCTDRVKLRAVLSWGVRYNIADWVTIESGVRVADISHANLLDAQIFGQLTFVSRRIRTAIESLRE